jgi:hypothetical protein
MPGTGSGDDRLDGGRGDPTRAPASRGDAHVVPEGFVGMDDCARDELADDGGA